MFQIDADLWRPSRRDVTSIDGHKFDGNVGEVMLLNTAEEWKIENRTVNGGVRNGKVVTTDPPGVVDHPFHIHINPFQIVEFFDPNEVLPGTSTYKYIFEGTADPGQCLLDITKPDTWKPCDHQARTNLIWWVMFRNSSARAVFQTTSSGVPEHRSPRLLHRCAVNSSTSRGGT